MRNKNNQLFYILTFVFSLYVFSLNAQDTISYTSKRSIVDVGRYAGIHIDLENNLQFEQIKALKGGDYQKSKTPVLNFDNTAASIWLKFYVKNKTNESLLLAFDNTELYYIDAYIFDEKGNLTHKKGGIGNSLHDRFIERSNTVFEIGSSPQVIYIKIRSHSSIYLPIILTNIVPISYVHYKHDTFNGICLGIIIAMAFYNLFVYFLVRDRLYLYYFAYVSMSICVVSQQNGVGQFFILGGNAFANRLGFGPLLAMTAVTFAMNFLETKKNIPKGHLILIFINILMGLGYVFITILVIQPFGNIFFQISAVFGAIIILVLGIIAFKRGNKSAKYYVAAWSTYLVGVIITLLCLVGILQYNYFIFNALTIGTCCENILLAFVLANRINIYRDESSKLKNLAIQRLQENEYLVREQNKLLEEKVNERTIELQKSLEKQKSTQLKLIQSEKLASLGELTAGIAHEIQNPLNFVNNFSDLGIDLINDIKAERQKSKDERDETIEEELLKDLSDNQERINFHGKRASSIVKSMLEHSKASTGIKESTNINILADKYLRLAYYGLRAKDKDFNVTLETNFNDNLPEIEVIPQDIGRVLLNLINNAFYAVNFPEVLNPTVEISTDSFDNQIVIKVNDNGIGMSDAIKAKIYQPFFTTKPTGKGTGLGLSLAYDIVTKGHEGTIEVESVEGEGTTFVVKLPM